MKRLALAALALFFVSNALAQVSDVQSAATWTCAGSGASVSCTVMLGGWPTHSTTQI
jgi:hypothetical protein